MPKSFEKMQEEKQIINYCYCLARFYIVDKVYIGWDWGPANTLDWNYDIFIG